jgi:hypothetical protein
MTSKTIREMSSGARRALRATDETANDEERLFAAKVLGRAALIAYDRIIDVRHHGERRLLTSHPLDTDEAIEAEALRLCQPD